MPRQLTFDLPSVPALGRDDFFVSPANSLAVATVTDPGNWPGGKLVLVGPHGSGKTHLVHVWAAASGARIVPATALEQALGADTIDQTAHIAVENIDTVAGMPALEQALFHLHNLVLADGRQLLMTASNPPGFQMFTLPDLASRIESTQVATLRPADDPLLAAILLKLFADRQLVVNPDVITYLVSRMDRSFDAAHRLVSALDHAALSERRAITKPLATKVLDKISD